MESSKRKMKFLATKLAALESELVVSREILRDASNEVDKMFAEKYFPEVPVEGKQVDAEIQKFSEDQQNHDEQQNSHASEKESIEESLSAILSKPCQLQ